MYVRLADAHSSRMTRPSISEPLAFAIATSASCTSCKSISAALHALGMTAPYMVLDEAHGLMVPIALDDDHTWAKLVEDKGDGDLELVVRSQVGKTRCY